MQNEMNFQIGQRLVVGFPGYEIPQELRELVKRHGVANFILFSENIQSNGQLQRLCTELQALTLAETGSPAFITIDQEGGVVSRLGADAAVVPSAMCVSATGDPENACLAGQITGQELAALGVNFNLAPCMDINSNPQNPAIGVRSYGDTPETVSRYGVEMIKGLLSGGVLCCAKHFPGHGDTAVDSHLGLPTVDKPLEELQKCELIPFAQAIAAGIPAIMTTHILFPKLEPDGVPATMSRRIITGLLKETMGFEGLVVSDCMMMQAIQAYFGTVNGIVAALHAGVDLVFTSHSIQLAEEACIAISEALENGKLSKSEMEASVKKIVSYKTQIHAGAQDLGIVGCQQHRDAVRAMMEAGISLVQTPEGKCPELGASPLFLGCHPFRPTIASNPEDESISFPRAMQALLGGGAEQTPVNPTAAEIADLVARAKGHSAVVIGTYNGHIKTGQLNLVRALAELPVPVICAALRNPYDLLSLPPSVTCIAAYEYDALSMAAVAKVLTGKLVPTGKLPLESWRNP